MQDKIILGLLSLKPFTLYDLQTVATRKISLFYNSSAGSIHPALKKLAYQSFVTIEEIVEGGRSKKIYSITSEGRENLKEWLSLDIVPGKVKDEAIVRLFFFSEINKEVIVEVLTKFIHMVEIKILELTTINAESSEKFKEYEDSPKYFFQMKTLDFGLSYYKFLKNWYSGLLIEIENRFK